VERCSGAVRPDVEIDTFVVMPNHVHGIIVLPDAANGVTT
jgi:REP element-mobilizing transposase RayT